MAKKPASKAQARARTKGLTFFTGIICKKNAAHGRYRYASNNCCVACEAEHSAQRKGISKSVNKPPRAAKSSLHKAGSSALKGDPDNYTNVAFSLGNVEAIQRWVSQKLHKMGPHNEQGNQYREVSQPG